MGMLFTLYHFFCDILVLTDLFVYSISHLLSCYRCQISAGPVTDKSGRFGLIKTGFLQGKKRYGAGNVLCLTYNVKRDTMAILLHIRHGF